MTKLGFSKQFVNKIKMLYTDCNSALCINGIVSDYFNVKRSVRQGCPMSMIMYVIFQEPLYRAINFNKVTE